MENDELQEKFESALSKLKQSVDSYAEIVEILQHMRSRTKEGGADIQSIIAQRDQRRDLVANRYKEALEYVDKLGIDNPRRELAKYFESFVGECHVDADCLAQIEEDLGIHGEILENKPLLGKNVIDFGSRKSRILR